MAKNEELINMFSRTLCGNGNLLVNIGPKPDGTMPREQVERLLTLTRWIEKNEESVYGTYGGPFKQTEKMGSTYKKNKLYLHIRDAKSDTISLSLSKEYKVKNAIVLATGQRVESIQQGDRLVLILPQTDDTEIRVIELTLNKKNKGKLFRKFTRVRILVRFKKSQRGKEN